ncbi:hypothetical protein Y032_0636g943 [Ancylostoma ceylanicum]|uniref:Uncharacterized protein n=1 Tax=Ancylostoma ceylanicum TaxID=53326 RepID=A0A016WLN5_9BILA|nr:hypothetical protein Y032_0636g943 [Ancylostoma ceylanicum]
MVWPLVQNRAFTLATQAVMENTPDLMEDPAKSLQANRKKANRKRSIVFQGELAAGQDSGYGQTLLENSNDMLRRFDWGRSANRICCAVATAFCLSSPSLQTAAATWRSSPWCIRVCSELCLWMTRPNGVFAGHSI